MHLNQFFIIKLQVEEFIDSMVNLTEVIVHTRQVPWDWDKIRD